MHNFNDMHKMIYSGTTAVGVIYNNGIILAADTLVTNQDYNIVSLNVKKVFFLLDNYVAVATSGIIGDTQNLVDLVKANLNLYILENKSLSIKGIASFVSSLLFSYSRKYPYFTEAIIGGIDNTGPHIYGLDMAGSIIEDSLIAVGEGATLALGVLESKDIANVSLDEAKKIVYSALISSSKRSALTGSKIQMIWIDKTKGGFEETIDSFP
ncbi:MAG: proteasome subunit beta [Candidatus Asgardarchaeia archaeon]